MKLANAKKILEHYLGKDVVRFDGRQLIAHSHGQVFSSYLNGGSETELSGLHVRRENDHSDSMSDYFAGHFYDSMASVINAFLGRELSIKHTVEVDGAKDWQGNPAKNHYWVRFNVRMEGSGTKMKPVLTISSELRLVDKKGQWPLAGQVTSFRTVDDALIGLIDNCLADKGEDNAYLEEIIMDRLAEVCPEAYQLFERLHQQEGVAV